MSKRYSILVREFGSDTELTLCEVDNKPEAIAKALGRKQFGERKNRLCVYSSVRIRDNADATAS